MNVSFKVIFSDKIIKRSISISLGLLFFAVVFAGLLYVQLPPYMPIFNQLPWGIERLAHKAFLFLPVGMTLMLIFLNGMLARYIYGKAPLVVRMWGITILFLSFISLIFVVRTIVLIL